VVVGIPALRIRGAQLAVVTLAAGLALEQFVLRNPAISGVSNPIPAPELFGLDLGVRSGTDIARVEFGLFVLAVVVLAALGVGNLMRSATGRRFLAVRSNERAAMSLGIDVSAMKLVAFALASFLAGIGGSLIGYSRGQLSADSFGVFVGVSLLAFAYLGGITSISGAFVAGTFAPLGLGFVLMTHVVAERIDALDDFYFLIGGIGLITTAIFNPQGIAGAIAEGRRLKRAKREAETAVAPVDEPAITGVDVQDEALRPVRTPGPVVLDARDISVSYGGIKAVTEVSLEVRAQQIVGLIGPNGAGKTTFIDALTGFVASQGVVRLSDEDVTGLGPHRRSARGLVRTWQSLELFDELSVRQNLLVGVERTSLRSVALDLVRPSRRLLADRVDWALEVLQLTDVADARPSELSLGRQKLVGVARAVAMDPAVVLLDEPAAGLDSTESRVFGDRLRAVAAAGVAVLLVDHDMGLVLDACDDLYVIEFGGLIAHGPPAEVVRDARVVEAYLGSSAQALAAS
jgi:ABC-type branched-subunit amino acid transport system ATPase component/ABC-type branched-subunit amino acid transport system permease subunit